MSLVLAIVSMVVFLAIFGPPSADDQERNRILVAVLNGTHAWVALLLVAVTPGVCEELLFRGFVQTRLVQRFGPALGILVAAALFAAMHMHPMQSFIVFPVGVLFGVLAWASRSVVPSMAAHAVYNASVLGFAKGASTFIEQGTVDVPAESGPWLSIPVFVVLTGLTLTPVAVYRLLRPPP